MGKNLLIVFIALCVCSCNYRWIIRKDKNGRHHIVKDYPRYFNKDGGEDKFVFRTEYKQTSYSCGNKKRFTFYGDSLFVGDSVTYFLISNSKKYIDIFRLGLISADLLRQYQPQETRVRHINIETGKEVKEDLSMETFGIGLEELQNMRTKKTVRRFKYTIGMNNGFETFYFELKNGKANRKTPVDSFIKGAHLIFFCQSPFLAI